MGTWREVGSATTPDGRLPRTVVDFGPAVGPDTSGAGWQRVSTSAPEYPTSAVSDARAALRSAGREVLGVASWPLPVSPEEGPPPGVWTGFTSILGGHTPGGAIPPRTFRADSGARRTVTALVTHYKRLCLSRPAAYGAVSVRKSPAYQRHIRRKIPFQQLSDA